MNKTVKTATPIKGRFTTPGDKSISHRSVMLSALAEGETHISGFLNGDDCKHTIDCFRKMGVHIDLNGTDVVVHGVGLKGLKKPSFVLDVGNSGTTIRLLTGLLSWQNFTCDITGDESILRRPMDRVIEPLSLMGAYIQGSDCRAYAPLIISGRELKGISYTLPVASAQVKSAVLLAGLGAYGETSVHEYAPTRDHTEIMLKHMGANIRFNGGQIVIKPCSRLKAMDMHVPGDISSAAFLIVAATIIEGSHIIIENVNVNPRRTGIITALTAMGADIKMENKRLVCAEPVADIVVKSAKLKGKNVSGDLVVRMIDEIPVFAVAASHAQGQSVVSDARELMVKETNRIQTTHDELRKMGADIKTTEDGMVINGVERLTGAQVTSHGDHRIAMSLAVAALAAQGETQISNVECADVSFPEFFDMLAAM